MTASTSNSPEKNNQLSAFRREPEESMRMVYREHREVFFAWAKERTHLSKVELADVFQDCVLVLFRNIQNGNLKELQCTIRTYLFGIGKNMLFARYRVKDRMQFPGDNELLFPPDFDYGAEEKMIATEEEQHLSQSLMKLSENCQKILKLTFYENEKSASIALKLGYSSEEVVRVQRKRCLDRLRSYFIKI